MTDESPRFCREAQSQLPAFVNNELTGWPLRVVNQHLKHCKDCTSELDRQRSLATTFESMKDSPPEPPADLLDNLLITARNPGLRGRAAVPTRGAVSGARPALSVAFLTVGAAASTGIGYGLWRGIRRLRNG